MKNNKQQKISIFQKLFYLVLGIILFAGLIAVITVYFLSFNTAVDGQKKYVLSLIKNNAKIVEDKLQMTKLTVENIANKKEIKDFFINEMDKNEEMVSMVESDLVHFNSINQYDSIYLLNKDGIAVVSIDPKFKNQDYSFRDYFKQIKNGEKAFVDSYIGITTGKLGYYVSVPVINDKKEVIGVVVAKLQADVIQNIIDNSSKTEGFSSTVMIADKYGVVLYSNKQDKIFKSLGPLSEDIINSFSASKRFNEKTIDSMGYKVIADDINSGLYVPKVFDFYDEDDKENEILAIAPLGDFPFYIIYEIEKGNFIGESIRVAALLSLIVLGAAFSSIIIINIGIKRILYPIRLLKEGADKVAKGDYKISININTKDEFKEFSDTFNEMVKKVDKEKKYLEEQVEFRVKNINKLNKHFIGRELKMVKLKKEIAELKKNKK